jgi:hypothetical protein
MHIYVSLVCACMQCRMADPSSMMRSRCLCVCVCIYVYVCVCVCVLWCVCAHMHIYMHKHTHTYTYLNGLCTISRHSFMKSLTSTCIIYTYIHSHTYIYIPERLVYDFPPWLQAEACQAHINTHIHIHTHTYTYLSGLCTISRHGFRQRFARLPSLLE